MPGLDPHALLGLHHGQRGLYGEERDQRALVVGREVLDEDDGDVLRLEISPEFQYDLYFGPKKPGDIEVVANGITVCFDKQSAKKANGMAGACAARREVVALAVVALAVVTLADRGWRRAFRARAAGAGFFFAFFAFFAMGAIENGTPVYRARPIG